MHKLLLLTLSLFALSLTAAADDKKDEKIDAAKLIGKWSPKGEKEGGSAVLEFAKDGKVSFVSRLNDKEVKGEGTYAVDGNKVTITISAEGKELKMERFVTKLTAEEMVTKDDKGAERTFLKVKDKK